MGATELGLPRCLDDNLFFDRLRRGPRRNHGRERLCAGVLGVANCVQHTLDAGVLWSTRLEGLIADHGDALALRSGLFDHTLAGQSLCRSCLRTLSCVGLSGSCIEPVDGAVEP